LHDRHTSRDVPFQKGTMSLGAQMAPDSPLVDAVEAGIVRKLDFSRESIDDMPQLNLNCAAFVHAPVNWVWSRLPFRWDLLTFAMTAIVRYPPLFHTYKHRFNLFVCNHWLVRRWIGRQNRRCSASVSTIQTCLCGFVRRYWRISQPPGVVFDESHFGKFTQHYQRGTYVFDIHPPLGKITFAYLGFLIGYDNNLCQYDNINDQYGPNCEYWKLRCISAFFGSLVPSPSTMCVCCHSTAVFDCLC
jgi:hypothetical protein